MEEAVHGMDCIKEMKKMIKSEPDKLRDNLTCSASLVPHQTIRVGLC